MVGLLDRVDQYGVELFGAADGTGGYFFLLRFFLSGAAGFFLRPAEAPPDDFFVTFFFVPLPNAASHPSTYLPFDPVRIILTSSTSSSVLFPVTGSFQVPTYHARRAYHQFLSDRRRAVKSRTYDWLML